jgi:hypothetical protein
MDIKYNSKITTFANCVGALIQHQSALPSFTQLEGELRGAYGMFSHFDINSIFIFDRCPVDSLDYVIAHELGHFVSCKLDMPVHLLQKNKDMITIYANLKTLLTEEEYRADAFAIKLMSFIFADVPQWVYDNRMVHYSSIPEERVMALNSEVDSMIQYTLRFSRNAA